MHMPTVDAYFEIMQLPGAFSEKNMIDSKKLKQT